MLGALIFGLAFHFVLDTPDLYSNVQGTGARTFFVSAGLLATVEFIGFVWGAIVGGASYIGVREARLLNISMYLCYSASPQYCKF